METRHPRSESLSQYRPTVDAYIAALKLGASHLGLKIENWDEWEVAFRQNPADKDDEQNQDLLATIMGARYDGKTFIELCRTCELSPPFIDETHTASTPLLDDSIEREATHDTSACQTAETVTSVPTPRRRRYGRRIAAVAAATTVAASAALDSGAIAAADSSFGAKAAATLVSVGHLIGRATHSSGPEDFRPATAHPSSKPSASSPIESPAPTSSASVSTCEASLSEVPFSTRVLNTVIIGIDGNGKPIDNGKTSPNTLVDIVKGKEAGGVIFMDQPAEGVAKQLSEAGGGFLTMSIDHEGGKVNRFTSGDRAKYPSQAAMSKLSDEALTSLVRNEASALKTEHFTSDYAPIVDVSRQDGKPSEMVQERLFSGTAEEVAARTKKYVTAMRDGGITPTLKHFPGGGSITENSDYSKTKIPSVPALNILKTRDLLPYASLPTELKDAKTGLMTGNFLVPDLGGNDRIASLNPATYTLARELGFKGPIVTDDLRAGAVKLDQEKHGGVSLSRAVIDALIAGADQPLYASSPTDARDQLKSIIDQADVARKNGTLTEARINEALARRAASLGKTSCQLASHLRN